MSQFETTGTMLRNAKRSPLLGQEGTMLTEILAPPSNSSVTQPLDCPHFPVPLAGTDVWLTATKLLLDFLHTDV